MKTKRKVTALAMVGLSALLLAPTAAFAAAPASPSVPTTAIAASVTTPATGQVTTTSSGYIDFVNHSSHTAYLDGPMNSVRGNWYWTAPFPEGTAPDPARPLTENPDLVTVPPGQEIGVDLTHTAGTFQGLFRIQTDPGSGSWIACEVRQAGSAPASISSFAPREGPNIHMNNGVARRTYTISDGKTSDGAYPE